ncbi:hypothetical protein NKDENANG_00781 [Candidatus Entotheonellaceae bacterium PAL068K]
MEMSRSGQPTLCEANVENERNVDVKELVKLWSSLAKPLQDVAKAKVSKATGLDELARALDRVPAGETLQRAVEELRERTNAWLRHEREIRQQAFRRLEAELIRELRNAGQALKELDNSWRIGRLALEVGRDRARSRALYNGEQVIAWKAIATTDDLQALLKQADAQLDKQTVPTEVWVNVLWSAYSNLRQHASTLSADSAPRVPIREMFRECRIELVRKELSSGQPGKRLTRYSDFPKWAFLYNLDRYRSLGSQVPENRRLAFETGSQVETNRIGFTLSGLDPMQNYKIFCYVRALR